MWSLLLFDVYLVIVVNEFFDEILFKVIVLGYLFNRV